MLAGLVLSRRKRVGALLLAAMFCMFADRVMAAPQGGFNGGGLEEPPSVWMESLGVPLYDDDLTKLCVRFLFNAVFMGLLVGLVIRPNVKKKEFLFTAVMMNVMVFFICFTLKKLDLGLGMALGLFAIFGVLRYRTDAIRTKEMTYLFVLIGIAVTNSLSNKKTSLAELVAVNVAVLMFSLVVEKLTAAGNGSKKRPGESKQTLVYDKLKWLGAEHRSDLVADIKSRTGIDPLRIEIVDIDLKRDQAKIAIWYASPEQP